jgi:hypothetical protein
MKITEPATRPARFDADTVRIASKGRWREILLRLNIDVPPTAKQHGPCPTCGVGKDRFRFDDKEGNGSWFCNQCDPKAGDGFALVQNVKRCPFPEALHLVAGALGLSSDNGNARTIVKTYDYTDATGTLLFQVVRFEPKDFRQRRPDGQGGWIWNLGTQEPVLYKLPAVMSASQVLIVEGEKDVETAYRLGLPDGWAATCNPMGAGKWRNSYSDALVGTHAVILPDEDGPAQKYAGQKHANQVAESLLVRAARVSRLTLPDGAKDLSVWAATHTPEEFAALLTQATPWDPIPIPSTDTATTNGHALNGPALPPHVNLERPAPMTVIPLDDVRLPDFPLDALPAPLAGMVDAVSRATETPIELAAMMGFATVAACTQHLFEVSPDAGYSEPLNLWTVAALESGNRKTAVHRKMTEPLRKKERELCEESKMALARAESERATIKERVKALRSRLANSADAAESADCSIAQDEISRLEASMPDVPAPPRLWAQDITPEKLGMLMADNGERLALLSDEGGLFDIMAGRYSNGVANLDTFLQAHAGAPVRVDRGSRPPVVMHSPALTIGLSPQPGVLRGLTEKSGFRDRGLLARFLYALPTSRLGYRSLKTEPVPDTIADSYNAMVEALLNFEPGKTEYGEAIPFVIRLSDEARQEWQVFAEHVEFNMRQQQAFEHIKDWAGKLPGAALRMAGNFHCVLHAQGQPWAAELTRSTITNAVTVLTVLSQHALAVFNLMGTDPALDGARKVWRWVERNRHTSFYARDCFNELRGSFPKMADLDPALTVLVERGYLIASDEVRTGPGRPRRPFTVNPSLTKEWT